MLGWVVGLTVSAGWGLLLALVYSPAAALRVLKVGALNPEISLDGPWRASFFLALVPVYLSHLLLWFLVKLVSRPEIIRVDDFYVASVVTTGAIFSIVFLLSSQVAFRRLIDESVKAATEELENEAARNHSHGQESTWNTQQRSLTQFACRRIWRVASLAPSGIR